MENEDAMSVILTMGFLISLVLTMLFALDLGGDLRDKIKFTTRFVKKLQLYNIKGEETDSLEIHSGLSSVHVCLGSHLGHPYISRVLDLLETHINRGVPWDYVRAAVVSHTPASYPYFPQRSNERTYVIVSKKDNSVSLQIPREPGLLRRFKYLRLHFASIKLFADMEKYNSLFGAPEAGSAMPAKTKVVESDTVKMPVFPKVLNKDEELQSVYSNLYKNVAIVKSMSFLESTNVRQIFSVHLDGFEEMISKYRGMHSSKEKIEARKEILSVATLLNDTLVSYISDTEKATLTSDQKAISDIAFRTRTMMCQKNGGLKEW